MCFGFASHLLYQVWNQAQYNWSCLCTLYPQGIAQETVPLVQEWRQGRFVTRQVYIYPIFIWQIGFQVFRIGLNMFWSRYVTNNLCTCMHRPYFGGVSDQITTRFAWVVFNCQNYNELALTKSNHFFLGGHQGVLLNGREFNAVFLNPDSKTCVVSIQLFGPCYLCDHKMLADFLHFSGHNSSLQESRSLFLSLFLSVCVLRIQCNLFHLTLRLLKNTQWMGARIGTSKDRAVKETSMPSQKFQRTTLHSIWAGQLNTK